MYKRQHQRNAEQHSHGEAAPKKAELDVGLAEKFASDARDAIAERKSSRYRAWPLECAGAHQEAQHDEKHYSLERRFI